MPEKNHKELPTKTVLEAVASHAQGSENLRVTIARGL
jgi:hypothetical protein